MISCIEQLKASGADKVFAWTTHAVFDKNVPDKLQSCDGLEYLLTSNTVSNNGNSTSSGSSNASNTTPKRDKIRVLNIAPLIAEAVARSMHNQSISGILDLDAISSVGKVEK